MPKSTDFTKQLLSVNALILKYIGFIQKVYELEFMVCISDASKKVVTLQLYISSIIILSLVALVRIL